MIGMHLRIVAEHRPRPRGRRSTIRTLHFTLNTTTPHSTIRTPHHKPHHTPQTRSRGCGLAQTVILVHKAWLGSSNSSCVHALEDACEEPGRLANTEQLERSCRSCRTERSPLEAPSCASLLVGEGLR